ncbi:MAG TPA: hypothetical protein VJI96_04545 [Candidatus Andersenbacteria bacterium]|nr:hypothetical protein [Candidatus Andersenbacteria bacterium]
MTLRPATVLIDLEGIVRMDNAARRPELKIEWLIRGINQSFPEQGVVAHAVRAFARTVHVEAERRRLISSLFESAQFHCVWSDEKADIALKQFVSEHLIGVLDDPKPVIILIANDQHFVKDVERLKAHGYEVWAMGTGMGKRLKGSATKVVFLQEVLGRFRLD